MSPHSAYRFGPYLLEPEAGLLHRGSEVLVPAPRVFNLLCILVRRRGAVVDKAELLNLVWGEVFVEESNLTQTIFLLRKLLGKDSEHRDYIQTVARKGYRFAAAVEPVAPGSAFADGLASSTPLKHPPNPEAEQPFPPVAAPAPPHPVLAALVTGSISPGPNQATAPQGRPSLRTDWLWAWLTAVATFVLAATLLADWQTKRTAAERPRILRYTRLTNDGYSKATSSQLVQSNDRVFLTENVDGRSLLAEVRADGTVLRHSLPFNRESVFSASNNRLLLGDNWDGRESPLVLLEPGAEARPLPGLVAHGAAWDPDGTSIAVVRGHQLLLISPEGKALRTLAAMESVPFWPRWSPDGRRIRFSTMDGGRFRGIYEVAVSDPSPHPVFEQAPFGTESCCGDWSPDGSNYVMVLGNSRESSLWVSHEHDDRQQGPGPPQLLAEGPLDTWRAPLVARDGRHVYAIGEHRRGELVRFDPESATLYPWMHSLSGDTPSISPDGSAIVYTAYPEGTLWRSRLDGSDRQQLTREGQLARFAQWSPNGKWISFTASSPGTPWQVYVMGASGGSARAVLPAPVSQGFASWSPDSTRLAFGTIASYGVGRRDLAQLTILDLGTGAATIVPGSENLWMARWSPDGRYLAATNLGRDSLKLFDFHSQRWRDLPALSVNDLCWAQHSPHTLFVDSPNAGHPAIFRIDVDGYTSHFYASLENLRRTGFDGWRLALAPDDTPVLLRDAGTQELYSLEVQF